MVGGEAVAELDLRRRNRSADRLSGVARRGTGAHLCLLAAVAAGLLGQGAYYPSVQRPFGLLVVAATLLALTAWPLTRRDLLVLPVVPAMALAAWAIVDGALRGDASTGVRPALLLIGVVATLLVSRRLSGEDREVLLAGVVGIGLLVALAGWLGVAARIGSWAFQAQGLWRASSTLTYPNATAAVLVLISLVVLGRLVEEPRSAPLALAATGLLTGVAATLSRAGALALVVGLVVLAGLLGLRATARATLGPVAGAFVALVCLLPSMPSTGPPRPALAGAGLAIGLVVGAITARVQRWSAVALLLGVVLTAGPAWLLGTGSRLGGAAQTVGDARVNLASPDRTGALHAALRLIAQHPLIGAGPGRADLRWKGQGHGTQVFAYVHNEYVQIAAELGLVGLVLLAVVLVAIARMLWSARTTGPARATWAGAAAATVAFAVHSGFDFVWHLPAIVLTVPLLAGVVLPAPDIVDAHSPLRKKRKTDENQAAV
jgi:hypothetical protein